MRQVSPTPCAAPALPIVIPSSLHPAEGVDAGYAGGPRHRAVALHAAGRHQVWVGRLQQDTQIPAGGD